MGAGYLACCPMSRAELTMTRMDEGSRNNAPGMGVKIPGMLTPIAKAIGLLQYASV